VLGAAAALTLGLIFIAYRAVALVYDRWCHLRHRGVVHEETLDDRIRNVWVTSHRDSDRPDAPGGGRAAPPAADADQVFQYLDCAYTTFAPRLGQSNEDEPDVYRLARREGPTALQRYEAEIWDDHLADPDVRRRYREQVQLGRVLIDAAHCLYCNSPLKRGATRPLRFFERELSWRYYVATCPVCGWWCVTHFLEEDSWFFWSERYTHAYAVMRRYDPLALETPLSLARDHLRRNPHKLGRFDPFRFEDLMADCLRDAYGDCEIIKLGGRQDQGIDIKAVRADGHTTLIQVKTHRPDFTRSESVRPIRELHGVMLTEGVPHGMVITTAHDYSPAAKDLVRRTKESLDRPGHTLRHYSMELLALSDVIELLGTGSPAQPAPWERLGIRLDVGEPGWDADEDWIDRAALPDGLADAY